MHKDFYASGFLYHPASEQILLQQNTSVPPASSPWSLFEVVSTKGDPETAFKDTILDLLEIKINVVHPIYSYFNEDADKNQFMGYATIRTRQQFAPKNGLTFAWFSFKDVLKLQTTKQMKHDIVVGQRVIEAATRKRLGEHTFQ
jgi:hypothetical protein